MYQYHNYYYIILYAPTAEVNLCKVNLLVCCILKLQLGISINNRYWSPILTI